MMGHCKPAAHHEMRGAAWIKLRRRICCWQEPYFAGSTLMASASLKVTST
jgi:hypothetical protein